MTPTSDIEVKLDTISSLSINLSISLSIYIIDHLSIIIIIFIYIYSYVCIYVVIYIYSLDILGLENMIQIHTSIIKKACWMIINIGWENKAKIRLK